MKTVRLGVIGCGGFVHYHLRAIAEQVPGFRCVALVDPVEANARRVIGQYPFADEKTPIYADHGRMLREIRPQAVIVSTPHTLHFRHCYDALSAGAHVLVDKPMVTNSADARRLVRRAGQQRRILQIAVQGCYTDTFAYARDLLSNGVMGELQLVTGVLAQGWLEGTRGKWRQDPALSGGGQLYDSTSHVISAMMFLVDCPVREAYCMVDNKGTRVDINAVAVVRFANGAMATLTSGGNCPSWKSHLTFQGARALMEISAHGGGFEVTSRHLKQPIKAAPRRYRTTSPVKNFYEAILGKTEPRCPGRVGILMADFMDALYASAARRAPVRVNRRMPV